MATRSVVAIFVLLVPFVLITASERAGSDPKITSTLADWKGRLERFQSVRYRISGKTEIVNKPEIPASLQGKLLPEPPSPKEKPLSANLLIDIANKRFRLEETELVPSRARDKWVPQLRVTAYNGQAYQSAFPRDRNDLGPTDPDLSISKGNLGEIEFAPSFLWPAFAAHGIVPTVSAPLRADRLPTELDEEELINRGTVAFAGRKCVVLKTNPTGTASSLSDEFWVDPARHSAILRHTYWQGSNPWFRFDVEYKRLHDTWLPEKWTNTFTEGGRVMTITQLTVDLIEANPQYSEQEFTIPVIPGMVVQEYNYPTRGKGLDPTLPAKGKYRVGPGGDSELLEPRTGFTTMEGLQLPPESGTPQWLWWVFGGAGLIIALVVTVKFGRRTLVKRNQ